MAVSTSLAAAHPGAQAVLDKDHQRFDKSDVGTVRANRPPKSRTVYASHYTSSFVEEDVVAAKFQWLKLRAQELFRRKPDPEEMRGRPRYRDWEY